MPYKNPDLHNNNLPTIIQIKRYLRMSNNISKQYRDVRPLMSFLQALPKVDMNLFGLIQTRKLAILGFNYTIELPEGIKPSEQELKRIEEIKKRFVASKIKSEFSAIVNGILFGMSATRMQYGNTPLGTMVISKKRLELTEIDYDLDNADNLILVSTDNNSQTQTKAPLPAENYLFVRHNPFDGIDNIYVGSVMRSNMMFVWLKYYDMFNWAKGNEKFADPLIAAMYKKGVDEREIDKVKEGLEILGTDSRAAFSDDVKLELLEAVRTGGVNSHKEFIDIINREQAISVLGQTLTSDVGDAGSRAAAQVHDYVRKDIMWADINIIQDVINDQYIVRDYQNNYGDPADAYPQFKFITDEIEDHESNARIIEILGNAGLPLATKECYAKTGFTQPQEGEEIFTPNKPIAF